MDLLVLEMGNITKGKGLHLPGPSSASLAVQPAARLLGARVAECEGGRTEHGKIGHG